MIINQIVAGSGGSAPAHYIEKTVDANGKLMNSSSFINLNGITDIGNYALYAAYSNNTLITAMNTGTISSISGNSAMMFCCEKATALITADLSSITSITGTDVFSSCFNGCTWLETVNLNGLNIISNKLCSSGLQMFGGCFRLKDLYLGGLTASTFANAQNQLQDLFNTSTGAIASGGCTIHFPANFNPDDPDKTFDITTLSGYPTFGGGSSYIHLAYDLPATE